MKRLRYIIRFFLVTALLLGYSSCKPKEPEFPVTPSLDPSEEELVKKDKDYLAKVALRDEYMEVYYYWADNVSSRNRQYKPYKYSSIYDWFDALLYTPTDRWSWMEDKESYAASQTGTIGGEGTWGISVKQPADDDDFRVFVSRVIKGSPLERFGVTRGAQLKCINDLDITDGFSTQNQIDKFNKYMSNKTATFCFRLTDGRDTSFAAAMVSSLSTNYILKTAIYTNEDFPGLKEPVGYFHYMSFNANFIDDIHGEMAKFKAAGVKKMIVDLRYNGGGDSRASDALMGYLAPKSAIGKPYVTRTHNRQLFRSNKTQYIPNLEGNLGLDEVFFIMHSGSASASEMTFNGLRPYLKDKLHHVGGQSYGKPNGMYVLYYPTSDEVFNEVSEGNYSKLQYVFYPISFYNLNSEGEQIPSGAEAGSGFVPDFAVDDDIFHDFGPEEADIKACLNYIAYGTFESAQDVEAVHTKSNAGNKGIKAIFSEEETDPHYGKCYLPLPEEFRKRNNF